MEDERRGGWVLRAVTTFYILVAAGLGYRYGEHVTIVMLSIGIIWGTHEIRQDLRHWIDDLRNRLDELQDQIQVQPGQ
jgi:hypothetical protein